MKNTTARIFGRCCCCFRRRFVAACVGVKILIGMENSSFSIVLGIEDSATATSNGRLRGEEPPPSSYASATSVALFAWQLPILVWQDAPPMDK
jgi:hypothetical protein